MTTLSLKALREQARRTQKEAADLCDVSLSTYRRWEQTPDDMPHGLWLQLTDFLERSVQIRKEQQMKQEPTRVTVRGLTQEEEDELLANPDWTVPVPEWLTDEFPTERELSLDEWNKWETRHVEPYPGFADAFAKWERAWQEVELAQLKADGVKVFEADPIQVSPEFDPVTGEPVIYDEHMIAVDPDTGKETLWFDENELSDEELALLDAEEAEEAEAD